MKNRIVQAKEEQFEEVRDFYWNLIEGMESMPYKPGWEKGIYPSDAFLKESLKNRELYVYIRDERLIAAMVLNQECNEGYAGTQWSIEAKGEEVTVLHALGVDCAYQSKGIARKMVLKAIDSTKTNHRKTIRLDVLNGNKPALRLYEGTGFRCVRKVSMYYEDTGWTDFFLFERVLTE